MLAIVCMIRTGESYLPDFIARVHALAAERPLRVIVGENDSRDESKAVLANWAKQAPYQVTVLECGDNSNHYPSVDIPERWASIAGVMNRVLDEVTEDDDHVMYVDADLVWGAAMVGRLLDRLVPDEVDVVAPLTLHPSGRPYDIWGTRRYGERIQRIQPWFERVTCRGLVDVDSAACFNVMDAHWARIARFGETNANVGWHDEMRAKGAHIFVDFEETVLHP